jgi:hypothetical protein
MTRSGANPVVHPNASPSIENARVHHAARRRCRGRSLRERSSRLCQWWASPTDRPELAKAINRLDTGDVLVVTRLDRLARSTRDLLNVLDELGSD